MEEEAERARERQCTRTSERGHGAQPGEPSQECFSFFSPPEVHKFCAEEWEEKENLIVSELSYRGIPGAVASPLAVCPYLV